MAKIGSLKRTIEVMLTQELNDAVYWIEAGTRQQNRVSLHAASIDVAPMLRKEMFEKVPSVILTSATLCTGRTGGRSDPFAYIRSRLGIVREKTLLVGSPFDYSRQVRLHVEDDLPEPSNEAQFMPQACRRIMNYLSMTNGGAFVLFTSYAMLRAAGEQAGSADRADGADALQAGREYPPQHAAQAIPRDT